eukprot:761061-Prorocentrum_minimum.AAC.1
MYNVAKVYNNAAAADTKGVAAPPLSPLSPRPDAPIDPEAPPLGGHSPGARPGGPRLCSAVL